MEKSEGKRMGERRGNARTQNGSATELKVLGEKILSVSGDVGGRGQKATPKGGDRRGVIIGAEKPREGFWGKNSTYEKTLRQGRAEQRTSAGREGGCVGGE